MCCSIANVDAVHSESVWSTIHAFPFSQQGCHPGLRGSSPECFVNSPRQFHVPKQPPPPSSHFGHSFLFNLQPCPSNTNFMMLLGKPRTICSTVNLSHFLTTEGVLSYTQRACTDLWFYSSSMALIKLLHKLWSSVTVSSYSIVWIGEKKMYWQYLGIFLIV